MKKFKFKLQAVLTVRQRAEQTALEFYARAVLNRQQAMRGLTEIEHQLSKMRLDWQEEMKGGCVAARLQEAQAFDRVLELERQRRERVLARTEIELNKALQKVLFCRQQLEAVEINLEQQRSRHDEAVAVDERKTIDDIVNSRASTLRTWRAAPELKLQ